MGVPGWKKQARFHSAMVVSSNFSQRKGHESRKAKCKGKKI
jgi:hypothetical protein